MNVASLYAKKMFVADEGLPNAGTSVSGTDTYYSKKLDFLGAKVGAMHIWWTGTPTGTLTVWASNDDAAATDGDTQWVQQTIDVPTQPAGSADATIISLFHVGVRWVRVKYVNSSGTGVLRGLHTAKE